MCRRLRASIAWKAPSDISCSSVAVAGGTSAEFRQWRWTVSQWFDMLGAAGFAVERLLEPREDAPLGGAAFEEGSDDDFDSARAAMVPYTMMFKARKR